MGVLFVTACNAAPSPCTDAESDRAPAPGLRIAAEPIPEAVRAAIEKTTGLKGMFNDKENVFKVTQARSDVKVSVEGRVLEPFMGLTSWAAFTPGTNAPAVVAGDLVVFEDEVTPVMDALLDAGLAVTALHNHFEFEKPRTFFMHIGGEDDYEGLARGVRGALDAIKKVRAASAAIAETFPGPAAPTTSAIPQAKVDAVLALGDSVKSQTKDGMYKVVIGREVAMACGCKVGAEMGVNTWFALCGTEDAAACSGDFLTFPGELQRVLRGLRHGGIHIVAIHSHMEGETPPGIFLHFWGKGRAEVLARGFKAGLDAQRSANARSSTATTRFTFDDVPAGSPPPGWKVEGTNQKGPVATWRVTKDDAAPSPPNVLTLASVNHDSGETFNLCWTDAVQFSVGAIEVKFRANTGKEDQGGGLIWRVKDKDNYMIARMNPLEDNFRVYYVKDGARKQLATANVKVVAGTWHTLRIEQEGDTVRCFLDGIKHLEAKDSHIPDAGGVGVWTKADAASSFDDLTVAPGTP
jgi:hypothetical protein